MKKILSISLGSHHRDYCINEEIMGEQFYIERRGTNGDIKKAISLIENYDGKFDAFGMGGIDLYLSIKNRKYTIKQAMCIKNAAKKTPIVDGSGLKRSLEPKIIEHLNKENIVNFQGKKVLIPSVLDRYHMTRAIEALGGELIIGDIIFSLGINIPMYKLNTFENIAPIIAPVACRLPFKYLYPIGEEQTKNVIDKKQVYYNRSHIIAGDFHYIRRYMPQNMKNKIIITNTITLEDINFLKERGVEKLITTTPKLGERSFGTNVMEGVIVSLLMSLGKSSSTKNYQTIIEKINMRPRIEILNPFNF